MIQRGFAALAVNRIRLLVSALAGALRLPFNPSYVVTTPRTGTLPTRAVGLLKN